MNRRLPIAALLLLALLLLPPAARAADPPLGPNVRIFDPGMPVAEIQAAADAIHAQQVDDEMGSGRYALLFKPGVYGTPEHPLQLKVGYYTEVAGLGASPSDVVINGKLEVDNRCLDNGGTSNCLALNNFWRSASNLTINIVTTGQDGCRSSANFWAVSQAASLRRVVVSGGGLSLMDYCTAGPQFASGGFIADSVLPNVTNGSQQQWLTRNSTVASWSNGVWNQVFAGVTGAPDDSTFPNPPYTTLPSTPVSRERPYLFVDAQGTWNVRVPSVRTTSTGTSWAGGLTAGRTIPLSQFLIVTPGVAPSTINAALAKGRHVLFTPGVYDVNRTINVLRPDLVVLGLGEATLTSVNGATPLVLRGASGNVLAGVIIDAGTKKSPFLLQVGGRGHNAATRATAANPALVADVALRVGGPHVGKADVAMEVNAANTIIDNAWVWRADHGAEGFSGDTERWNTNLGRNGLVVNGADVTATGLFVEHFQQYNTVWNGERGRTVMYQSELAYDPPNQAAWTHDGIEGWAGYKVGPKVKVHRLDGGGVYVFNQNDPSIHTENGFEVPSAPGVRLHHVMTVNLAAGTIDHVVNGVGLPADVTRIGVPVYVTDFP